MKKFIIYAVFVFACGFTVFFTYRHMQASAYEATAIPYIQQVLPKISTWDAVKVRECLAPEVLVSVTEAELNSLLASLSRIGELVSIEEITFKNKTSGENITSAKQSLVTYQLKTMYSRGEAVVTISLLDKDGAFDLYHFNFQSQALAQ